MQKTAYEMRISDWSSDVCSSDLIPGRVRLLIEFLIAGVAVLLIVSRTGTDLYLPFFTDVYIPLGPLYYVFAMVLIVGFGNAVNLTDGLDGLATFPVIIASLTFLVISYLSGNAKFAGYLGIDRKSTHLNSRH